MQQDYLTVSQAARRLERCDETVRSYIRRGLLPALRTPLGSLIEAQAVEALRQQLQERGGEKGSDE